MLKHDGDNLYNFFVDKYINITKRERIEELKNNVNALKLENKIDEALVIVDEIKIKKSELEKLEKIENELQQEGDVKIMENKVLENKELLNNEQPRGNILFLDSSPSEEMKKKKSVRFYKFLSEENIW